jgi:ribosome-associated toxin RatA of RatAB toxin-antitoxin module
MVEVRSLPMFRVPATLWLVAFLVLAAAPARADDQKARLEKGEVIVTSRAVKGSDTPEMVARALIAAPPAKVWNIVSHCADYPRTMPRIKAAKELSRKGDKVVCKVTIEMPFPYSDLTSVSEATHTVSPARYARVWRFLSGDYKANSGSWVLTPYQGDPKRTLAVYRIHAEPKPWIPAWIRKKAQQRTIPEMMERLRKLTR